MTLKFPQQERCMKHIENGKKVGIIDLTQGELGTRGSAEIRMEEAKRSAEIMGIHYRTNLKMADGFFENNTENRLEIIKEIRKCRPQIVLANAIEDRHPDHGRASKLVSDACFYSGLVKIKTELNGIEQKISSKSCLPLYSRPHIETRFRGGCN